MTASIALAAGSAPLSNPSGTTSSLVIVILILVLLVAAGALTRSIGAIWDLVADLLRTLFASVRALMLIGVALCVIVIALAEVGGGADSGSWSSHSSGPVRQLVEIGSTVV